jgi:RimJ/RimL family protein N-acetyltransferase
MLPASPTASLSTVPEAKRRVQTRSGRAVEIRDAEPSDAPALLAYFKRIGAETPHLTFGGEGIPLTEAEERAHIDRIRSTDNALFIVALCDDEIIGHLTFAGGAKPRTRHAGELGISIIQPYWGEGLGKRLIELLIAWATTGGIVRKINLRVRTDNARAIALYAQLGFIIEGRETRTVCIDGQFHDGFLMGVTIDPQS